MIYVLTREDWYYEYENGLLQVYDSKFDELIAERHVQSNVENLEEIAEKLYIEILAGPVNPPIRNYETVYKREGV